MIPFNKPFIAGNELNYIKEAVENSKISGDGLFTKKCHHFFETQYGFKKVLLTTSCTDALEMAAILLDIKEGDEIIAPSYTFVSTVNAFVLRGAKIVFADSNKNEPNIDVSKIESLITDKTKAIVPVHYAGVACDMDAIMELAVKHNLYVVEDAAQAIDSYYTGKDGVKKALGSIGHLAAFSFHETKNIISGEGGMLTINDEKFIERAEIIREKGTNRSKFFRGEIDKYNWVDIGSSFLPSDIIAAFLYAQIENIDAIQTNRKKIWQTYFEELKPLQDEQLVQLPYLPSYSTNNGHMFYLVAKDVADRTRLINHLKENGIMAVFHYLSLHKSAYYKIQHGTSVLPNADFYEDCLVRLPLFFELSAEDQSRVAQCIKSYYGV
jgi:dTDP-4-amino-4,6-dideoxygalactose transaminase